MSPQKYIQLITTDLNKHIELWIKDIASITQFGSSIYGKTSPVMDIDIMILCQDTSCYNNFESQLISLKEKLLDGTDDCGFGPEPGSIINHISECILASKVNETTAIPMFKIGPLVMVKSNSKYTIYFHFKGPISEDEFAIFCKHFPFHARSIIHNHIIIKGSLEADKFNSLIQIEKVDLEVWNQALKKRIVKTSSESMAIKCLKKLTIQYLIYKGFYSNNPGIAFNQLKDSLGITNDIIFNRLSSLEDIKDTFSKIYINIATQENLTYD